MQHVAVRSLRHGTDDRPFIVFWEVTLACGLACAHCRAHAMPHRDPRELSTVEAQRLIDDLGACDSPRPTLVLTGGDPFEREDLAELVRYATQRGLHVICTQTSARSRRLTSTILQANVSGVAR